MQCKPTTTKDSITSPLQWFAASGVDNDTSGLIEPAFDQQTLVTHLCSARWRHTPGIRRQPQLSHSSAAWNTRKHEAFKISKTLRLIGPHLFSKLNCFLPHTHLAKKLYIGLARKSPEVALLVGRSRPGTSFCLSTRTAFTIRVEILQKKNFRKRPFKTIAR